MNKYDIIIIGGGPAGLTAGMYAGRRELKTLVLTMNIGGQMNMTEHVENYPGLDLISGTELAYKMMEQAQKFGAEVVLNSEVTAVEKKDDGYIIKSSSGEYEAQAVILAFGKTPRKLDVEGAEKYLGRGLSYCATCDGPLFKNKIVAVIGGGNSALGAAVYLSNIAEKVYLVHRRDAFRGDEVLVERLKEKENVELVLNSVVSGLVGEDVLEKMKVKDVVSSVEKEIEVNGIFVEVGYEVKADFIKNIVNIDPANQIIINSDCQTSEPGIFASGDLTNTNYKQIAVAVGHGATAALSAYDYIQKKSGKATVKVDWGTK